MFFHDGTDYGKQDAFDNFLEKAEGARPPVETAILVVPQLDNFAAFGPGLWVWASLHTAEERPAPRAWSPVTAGGASFSP